MPVRKLTKKRDSRRISHDRRFTTRGKQQEQPNHLRYILFFKPYGVLSQFTDEAGRTTLADFGPFPPNVYSVGRLDNDSEGLLLLTNDGALKHVLIEPKFNHPRTYLVQVERIPDESALNQLRNGVLIEGKKTLPAEVKLLSEPPLLPERSVPIRFRKTVPTCWLELTLREGRNRQVRKMTAAVGYPTLRIVRIRIANLTIAGLLPGQHREITENEFTELKKILYRGNRSGRN
ncbi:MAG: pseudouridine synthase [Ignavibacteriales bacterium]|nr:pseudouridine synthase [Ignavibacteriales bacterium]